MKIYLYILLLIIFFTLDPAFASRLESAAVNAKASIMTIAQITAGLSIGAGAIFYSLGIAQIARGLIIGGAIGIVATFGSEALTEWLSTIFR